MMFKRILVPLDGSARAESALPVAARLAHAYGASIELLKVVEAYAEYGAYLQSMLDEEKLEATRYLEKVAKSVELEGIEVEVNVMLGQVGKSIIAAAQASHASLIVLCSHGYSSIKRWMLGSVAEKVARLPLCRSSSCARARPSSPLRSTGRCAPWCRWTARPSRRRSSSLHLTW